MGGSTISYLYSADGAKLRTIYTVDGKAAKTDYCGNAIYENGSLDKLMTGQGYITLADTMYHYFLKDHQGSNRVIVAQNGTVEEVNHYYPSGGVFGGFSSVQPYKYNGKELDRSSGLNWYDYWSTNDPEQIRLFLEASKSFPRNSGSYLESFNFSSWNHSTDGEFLSNLTFNDETNMFYSSYGTVEDGVATRVGFSVPALKRDDKNAWIEGPQSRWLKKASGRVENVYPEFELLTALRGLLNVVYKSATKIGEHYVYRSLTANRTVQYVGITNDIARRSAEHMAKRGIQINKLIEKLSRTDARAVEQALIEIHGLSRDGGTLMNVINSISKNNPIYASSLKRGYELLKSINYK